MCLSVADCNEFFQISVNKKQSAVRQHTRRSEYFSKFRSNLEMETFGCFQKFSCKTSISHTLCYCETLFCTAISSTNLRQKLRCNTSYPQRSVGLEQSEQRDLSPREYRRMEGPESSHQSGRVPKVLGASVYLRAYKASSVLRMKAYSVMKAKVCPFLSCLLKKTQENKSPENQTSVERFCNIQTIWVGLGGSRLQ